MPNIFKAFSRAKAEPYQFPDAAELVVEPEPEEAPPAPEDSPPEEFFSNPKNKRLQDFLSKML